MSHTRHNHPRGCPASMSRGLRDVLHDVISGLYLANESLMLQCLIRGILVWSYGMRVDAYYPTGRLFQDCDLDVGSQRERDAKELRISEEFV